MTVSIRTLSQDRMVLEDLGPTVALPRFRKGSQSRNVASGGGRAALMAPTTLSASTEMPDEDVRETRQLRTPSGDLVIPTNNLQVEFKHPPRPDEIQDLRQRYGLGERVDQISIGYPGPRPRVATFVVEGDWESWLGKANDIVENESDSLGFATVDFLVQCKRHGLRWPAPTALPTGADPLPKKLWHLANTGQLGGVSTIDAGVLDAWRITMGKDDLTVAVVDDGVDAQCPPLASRMKAGFDFHTNQPGGNPVRFSPPYNELAGNDIHGTPCAGLIASDGTDQIWGVAPHCQILPIRIFDAANLVPSSALADALEYSAAHADVVNCSWTSPVLPEVEAALTRASREERNGLGVIFCFATGNEGKKRVAFPANHPNVVAVGACTNRGRRASYSNFGEHVSVVAPSGGGTVGLTTCDVNLPDRGFNPNSAVYEDFGGTSAATPIVSGVCALVLSVNHALTAVEVKEILTKTANKIDPAEAQYDAQGHSLQYGHGLVNAARAVREAWVRTL